MSRMTVNLVVVLAAVAGWIAWAVWGGKPKRPDRAAPVASPIAEERSAPVVWPSDALVLNAADAKECVVPFELKEAADAPGAPVLRLPEGAGTKEHTGLAAFDLRVPADGVYHAWARVKWDDECGNSLDLQVAGAVPHLVGNDKLFGKWHWVPAGEYRLATGARAVKVLEREDGIAVQQLLFTRDGEFCPSGAAGICEPEDREPRQFRDDFARSPGHGLGDWQPAAGQWDIAFSFDPNRIPNQYSLTGRPAADGAAAQVWLRGAPWNGVRLAFSFLPDAPGEYGAILQRGAGGEHPLRLALRVDETRARLAVTGEQGASEADLTGALRLRQWHRIEVERWAWTLRVRVDDREVWRGFDLPAHAGALGFFVASGQAAYDDVCVDEIRWQCEDGGAARLPWTLGDGARWRRGADGLALSGEKGALTLAPPPAIAELLLEEASASPGGCSVKAEGLVPEDLGGGRRAFRAVEAAPFAAGGAPPTLALEAGRQGAAVKRVAVRYGKPEPETFRLGLFHFTGYHLQDPSDYLDFTPEEYKKMAQDADAEKLRREAKTTNVLARSADDGFWVIERGAWRIVGGTLRGQGPGAMLRFRQEVLADLEVTMKLRLADATAAVGLEVYAGPNGARGPRVRWGAEATGAEPKTPGLALPADGAWHEVALRTAGGRLWASCDRREPKELECPRRDGGEIRLWTVSGAAEFDDVEVRVARQDAKGRFHAFDRRETDWWHEGGEWQDHQGITCILASHWTSLVAPNSTGLLWSKRTAGPDVALACNISENTEWHGWDRAESHTHHPADNVWLVLATEGDTAKGYRAVVNGEDRSATVLYRNGQEVARVAQDASFPLRYVGGHAPYSPRQSRLSLVKRGAELSLIVNGRVVLKYSDPAPLAVKRVALGGQRTRVNFSSVEVRELDAEPARVSARE